MCKAEDFTYTISGTTATIKTYNGSEKSVVFPKEITEGSNTYSVTSIVGTTNTPVISNSNVEEIFIPAGITTISYVTNDLLSLKNIIIEDGSNFINVSNPFNVSAYGYYQMQLNNIIVLSQCGLSSTQLVSNNGEQCLLKTGKTKVYLNEDEEEKTIQMYLYEKSNYNNSRPFRKIRFQYLLNALQKGGIDLNSITKIDLSDIPNTSSKNSVHFTFDTDNYNPSSELSPGAEVIISKTESYANGLKYTIIPDKDDFTVPTTDQPINISYSRSNTQNWNSVCLPFDIKESDFGTNCKIYTVTSASTANSQISLTRVENSETVVEAGTPCFIYSTAENWTLNLSDVTINSNVAPIPLPVGDNWQVVGSFTNKTIGKGKYKLNSSGTEFGITNNEAATVTAFRCYLKYIGSQGAPNRLSVNIDEEASITLVPNDAEPQKVKLYDLMGRPRKEGSQGIFIKSTR
jgi:hypothetical protein